MMFFDRLLIERRMKLLFKVAIHLQTGFLSAA